MIQAVPCGGEPAGARRLPLRALRRPARRAVPALRLLVLWAAAVVLGGFGPGAAMAQEPRITGASYAAPTDRYPHGVLGDDLEWGALDIQIDRCPGCDTPDLRRMTITLPPHRVFEDLAPRLLDVDGDDAPEVVVIESDANQGARLAIYDVQGFVTATPFIGTRFRWLAPLGAADLDGDGHVELAYIDRPHLAQTLRIWRYEDRRLVQVASLRGLTNHRIGQAFIAGGIRDCGAAPEMITADGAWRRIVATTWDGAVLTPRDIGPFSGPESLNAALGCS